MVGIIDAHSHYMPPEVAQNTAFFKQGWSDLDRQLGVMDEHDIERSVLLYPTSDAHLNMQGWKELAETYNSAMAKVVREYSGRFIGAGIVPFGDAEARDQELSMFVENGFSVVSLASSYDGIYLDDIYFEPVFQFATEHQLPVHVHAQIMNPIGYERVEDPLLSPVLEYVMDVTMCIGKMMMSGTLQKFPNVNFIFPHYGGVLPFVKERFDSTYSMLRRREYVKDLGHLPGKYFENLYYDMSGSKSVASLQCALEVTDPGHILFGSDFPANPNPGLALEAGRSVGFSKADVDKIFRNNMLNLIQ